jgi:predicted N-acyltransferase
MAVHFRTFSSVELIAEEEWNRLAVDASPMMEWEYFFALEKSGSVCEEMGYRPRHLMAYDDRQPFALAPLYERNRAWVEFGDRGLVEFLTEMTGIPFNHGLVGTIPFTPVPGYRFLYSKAVNPLHASKMLLDYMDFYCESHNLSTCRLYFISPSNLQLDAVLREKGYLRLRTEYSRWFNNNYTDFEDYLRSFRSSRRTKIRRELREMRKRGIHITMVSGEEAPSEYYGNFRTAYERTWLKHMGNRIRPFLNETFFRLLGENFRNRTTFAVASQGSQKIGMALFYRKSDTLYGRYWGCFEDIPFLHFATCYYRPIEYAIDQGIAHMDPGFGGDHKLFRGYQIIPVHHYLKFYGERQRRVAFTILNKIRSQNSFV